MEEPRFGMYVSLQEYAAEKLRTEGALPEGTGGASTERGTFERHGEYYARFGSEEALDALDTHGGLAQRKALEMELDNLNITGDTLAQYLTDQGFRVTVHNTAINTMRMWLAKAGLFPENGRSKDAWIPDLLVKRELVGMNDDTIAALSTPPGKGGRAFHFSKSEPASNR